MTKTSLIGGVGVTLLLALLVVPGEALAQDAKAPWAITFSHKPLDVITVPYRDGSATSFYYFIFTLQNKGDTDAPLGIHIRAYVGSNPRKRQTHLAVPRTDAEEFVRRISRRKGLKNVQQINAMKALKPGASVEGIAVLGTFHREWDIATVTVSGLEPNGLACRVRKFGDSGFTVAHRAYLRHNNVVRDRVGKDAEYTEVNSIIRHDVVWVMKFHREGDEFAPHLDPIDQDGEGWDVVADPGPSIVHEKEAPFK